MISRPSIEKMFRECFTGEALIWDGGELADLRGRE